MSRSTGLFPAVNSSSNEASAASPFGDFTQLNDVRTTYLPQFLNEKELVALACTSSAFYSETARFSYWRKQFFAAGMENFVLQRIAEHNITINYRNFLHSIKQFQRTMDFRLELDSHYKIGCLAGDVKLIDEALIYTILPSPEMLALICFSGSSVAINYALQKSQFSLSDENELKKYVLKFVVASGRVNVFDNLISEDGFLGPDFLNKLNEAECKKLCIEAAKSGRIGMIKRITDLCGKINLFESPECKDLISAVIVSGELLAINYVLNRLSDKLLPSFTIRVYLEKDFIRSAIKTGKIEVLEHILEFCTKCKFDVSPKALLSAIMVDRWEMIDWAATSGQLEMVNHIWAIYPPQARQKINMINLLSAAAWSGRVSVLEWALALYDEMNKIKAIPLDVSVLVSAVISRNSNVPAVIFMRKAFAKRDFSFDPYLVCDSSDRLGLAVHYPLDKLEALLDLNKLNQLANEEERERKNENHV